MAVSFERQITGIADDIDSDYKLASETIPIAVHALEEVDRRYGPESPTPLEFHNAHHSIGVARRNVRLSNLLHHYIPPSFRPKIFELAILAGATHDLEQGLGNDANERASTAWGIQAVEEFDGELNTKTFKRRLLRANLATSVVLDAGGELVQVNLQRGSRDPIKFITAFGDINGIAMEGDKRMWQDATNVYLEMTVEPTAEGLYDFLAGRQKRFMRNRLNDGRIKSDIAYYFPDTVDDVYSDMRKAYHTNIITAFGLARMLEERSDLKSSVAHIVRSFESRDRTLLGITIGKLVRRKTDGPTQG